MPSRKSPSRSLDKARLRWLLFHFGGMHAFRTGRASMFNVIVDHAMTNHEFLRLAFDERPPVIPHQDRAVFYLSEFTIADETYGVVTVVVNDDRAGERLVIEPFPIPDGDHSRIAPFPEES